MSNSQVFYKSHPKGGKLAISLPNDIQIYLNIRRKWDLLKVKCIQIVLPVFISTITCEVVASFIDSLIHSFSQSVTQPQIFIYRYHINTWCRKYFSVPRGFLQSSTVILQHIGLACLRCTCICISNVFPSNSETMERSHM